MTRFAGGASSAARRASSPDRAAWSESEPASHACQVREIDAWFGGKLLVRLKDARATELQVARDRVADLKQRIGA